MKGRKGSMRGSFRVPKQGPGGGGQGRGGTMGGVKVMKPKVETKMVRANSSYSNDLFQGSFVIPLSLPPQDISLFYQIFPEEILGSGQFGTVYGGVFQKIHILHSTNLCNASLAHIPH